MSITKTTFAFILNFPLLLLLSFHTQAQPVRTTENNVLGNVVPTLQPSSLQQSNLPETRPYTFDTGDIIRVTVYGLPDQGGLVQVFNDGTVTFPLIGTVNVRGKTIMEVNNLLTNLYSRYLKRPSVTVVLEQPRPLAVAIVGEVNAPGRYNLSGGIQLQQQQQNSTQTQGKTTTASNMPIALPKVSDLFTLAGGLTVSADVRQIQLKRTENGQQVVYNLDFWRLLQEGDLSQDVKLKDGDVIVVPKKEKIEPREYRQLADATFGIKYSQAPNVTIVGEVNRPGAYTVPLEQGPPRLTTAIQQSGGIRELADIRNIIVVRTTRDEQEQRIKVNLWDMLESGDINRDILLQDGDTIFVPRAEDLPPSEAQILASANFSPKEIVVNVIGSVKSPGATTLKPNTSLNSAILAAGGFDERRADSNNVELIRVNANGTVTKRNIPVNLAAEVNEETNPILKNNDVIVVNRSGIAAFGDSVESIFGPIGRSFSLLGFFNIFR